MIARNYRELRAWQLADELRREVIEITSSPPANRDLRFCDSFSNAAGSVCRLLSEGFARFKPRDFANYVRMALGSLAETEDHIGEAVDKQYIDRTRFDRMWDLSEHTKASSTNLLKYLQRRDSGNRRSQRW
jgi:four helix bundle protein